MFDASMSGDGDRAEVRLMVPGIEALERLREGNRRYVTGVGQNRPIGSMRRAELVTGQEPHAIILGCADSRVPPELLFDHGLGELFVVRVAGNVATKTQIGSIELAVERFSTRLIVVLGHTGCGMVLETLRSALERGDEELSPSLSTLVAEIQPVITALLSESNEHDPDTLLRRAVRANVRNSVRRLRTQSEILERLTQTDDLCVVGAEYSLETGEVYFFDPSSA